VTVVGLTTVYGGQHDSQATKSHRRSLTSGVSGRDVDRSSNVGGSADGRNVNSSCRVSDSGQVTSRSRSNVFGRAGSADAGGRGFAAGLGSAMGVAGAARLGRALALALGSPNGGGGSGLALGRPDRGGRGGL
jgi:hypothetical protein